MGRIFSRSAELVPEDEALKGDSHPVLENLKPHAVFGISIIDPWEDGQEVVYVDIGCYWGTKRLFQGVSGVLSTSVGFADSVMLNPTYRESCTRYTNHTKIVEVVYDPEQISSDQLIVKTSEAHDSTQGCRQGNDVGTQYRSAIYTTTSEQARRAQEVADAYVPKLADAGLGAITTKIKSLSETPAGECYRAGDERQQYLSKNPNGHCPVYSIGVAYGI